jgi:hypothetical protein
VKALVDAAKREPRLKKDVELYAALMRAIGQHGDASALDVLTDDIWNMPITRSSGARVLSLGRIRGKASVGEALRAPARGRRTARSSPTWSTSASR